MPYGYLGTHPNQQLKNAGIIDVTDNAILTKNGEAGGSLELIAQSDHSSNVATIDFTSIQESNYDVHCLYISNLAFPSSTNRIGIQLYESGTLETASVYDYSYYIGESAGWEGTQKDEGENFMQFQYQTTRSGTLGAYLYFHNLGNSSKYSTMTFQQYMITDNEDYDDYRIGGGVLPQASTVDGIRVMNSVANSFTDFNMKLYGYKK